MTGRPRRPPVEFEVVGVATGAGIVSGALALLGPYLASLTEALAALALAGWIAAHTGSAGARPPALNSRGGLALLALGAGAVVFFAAPAPFATARALVLGLALVPLWWTAPRRGP